MDKFLKSLNSYSWDDIPDYYDDLDLDDIRLYDDDDLEDLDLEDLDY